MRLVLLLPLLVTLAGCGAPGEPERPEPERPRGNVDISGTASIGVTGSF